MVAAIVVAGCAPSVPTAATFLDYVRTQGATFSVAPRAATEMSAEEAIATARGQRERRAAFDATTPLGETYGIITCPDATTCWNAFSARGVTTVHVWVISSLAPSGRDAGRWLAINAVTGIHAVTGPD